MNILFLVIAILTLLIVVAYFARKNEKDKLSVDSNQRDYSIADSSIVKKGNVSFKNGMNFHFFCPKQEELERISTRKGSRFTEKHNYGAFSLEISLKRRGELILYELSHSHIVPQQVCCMPKIPSKIRMSGIGYEIESYTGLKSGFLLIGAKSVNIQKDKIYLSVGERTWIALSEKGIPTIDVVRKFIKREDIPFRIITKDKFLDGFFNEWIWDFIEQEVEYDFDNAVALSAVRICYDNKKSEEFLKTAFFEAGDDAVKRSVALGLICEYAKRYGDEIFGFSFKGKTLRDYINNYALCENCDINESKDNKILRLYTVYEYIRFSGETETKLSIWEKVEKERIESGITNEDLSKIGEKYIFVYFEDKDCFANKICKMNDKDYLNVIKEYNPLYGATTPNFIRSALIFRTVVWNIFGVRKTDRGYTFSPRFPSDWGRAGIRCFSNGKTLDVDLIPKSVNAVEIDGVEYGGDMVEYINNDRGKCKVYFKE